MNIKRILVVGVLLINMSVVAASDIAILTQVNNDLNEIRYVSDEENYGVDDYFATLDEFKENGGDCEDYAISKYFKLKEQGITNLKITYVKYNDIAHMVLIHYPKNSAPLVLDNLDKEIKLLSERTDLIVVYQFNEQYLFVNNSKLSINNFSIWKEFLDNRYGE